MKRILIFLSILTIFTSCNNQDRQAKKLIKENMRSTLNDYKSYEPIEFGVLVHGKTSFGQSFEGKLLDSDILSHLEKMNEYLDEGIASTSMSQFYLDKSNEEKKIADELSAKRIKEYENYKGEECWKMTHLFRAKNAGGLYGIHNSIFYFNKEITKIIDEKTD